MSTKEIKQEWIEFGKKLYKDEWSHYKTKITDEEWNWFGEVMNGLRNTDEFKYPSGTECRNWPRAFFTLMSNPEIIHSVIRNCILSDYRIEGSEIKLNTVDNIEWITFLVYQKIYDLIGYGVISLERFKNLKL